eukprot:TRINITY_DN2476_c0_g1_i3.p1 TRINITY_DN2476_c0_g1~~TRINITY_DN2476_c0_g1_i3.p1  ORF type:complete len:269 (-),score=65.87 TRINITY_DN2476_c0_g1_i3:350-1156(-)
MYHDFNIPQKSKDGSDLVLSFQMHQKFQYGVVAWNFVLPNKPTKEDARHAAFRVKAEETEYSRAVSALRLEPQWDEVRQFSRLTIPMENPQDVVMFMRSNQELIRSFDILAIQPTNEKSFTFCCQHMTDLDIISLDATSSQTFPIRHASAHAAMRQGIHFEICYGPSLEDPDTRNAFLAYAMHLVRVTKGGANMILSSGVNDRLLLRSPLDVINLCVLFGMKWDAAKNCVGQNGRKVLLHAQSRKALRGIVEVEEIDKHESISVCCLE